MLPRVLLLAACVSVGPGCALDPPALDLVAAFPAAHLGVETGLIDFGVPASRHHLLGGFGADEQGFVWGLGDESLLEFFLAEPRDLPLTVRCAPLDFPGAPPQSVTFELNGHPGPLLTLDRDSANYDVVLPATAARAGWNRLLLRYAWARAPAEVLATKDRRLLAVAWDFIMFRDHIEGPSLVPTADGALGELVIPAGTSATYHLHPPAGTRLATHTISIDPGGSLAIRLEGDGGSEALLARLTRSSSRRAEIPLGWQKPVRLTFEAEGATVRLVRPTLHTPARSAAGAVVASPAARPNVLVYLVDTLRADRLGCYGHDRATSPHIDALARDGILFEDVVAESSWTRTTVASLFTGQTPPRHGVHGRDDALRGGSVTLSGLLRAAGYETAGFVTNGNVAPQFGLGQGFDHYQLLPGTIVPGSARTETGHIPRSNHLTSFARNWLRGRDPSRPFFLYLHAADPHGPYLPPPRFRRRLGIPDEDAEIGSFPNLQALHARALVTDDATTEKLFAAYDAEIAHNDHHFGRLISVLKQRGLYDDMLVVLVADHGEEFNEHGGWEHGQTLHHEVVGIPLIVKLPGGRHAGLRVETPAQLADVMPTLLARLAIDPPAGLDGVDLLAHPAAVPPARPRATFAHLALDGHVADAVQKGRWKWLVGLRGGELFDRRSDRAERKNLVAQHLATAGYLRARLLERSVGAEPARAAPLPPDVLENLRALGYVE